LASKIDSPRFLNKTGGMENENSRKTAADT
jgi:hypothetical protein